MSEAAGIERESKAAARDRLFVLCAARLPVDLGPHLGRYRFAQPGSGELSRDELLAELGLADALICPLSIRVDEKLLAAAPRLKIVANYAVGYDNIDIAAASRRGVIVTNTPDVLTEATADLAFALLMAAARRLGEGERLVRTQAWKGWSPDLLLGKPVFGSSLGVIGAGRIGCAMLRRGQGFGMQLRYSSPRESLAAEALGAQRCTKEELLGTCEFVSLHCPGSEGTRSLIDAGAISLMRQGAVLVNTARGCCVNEEALAAALASGHLGGAGLDVFEREPLVAPSLLRCDNVVLAPHLGSATHRARERMAMVCAESVSAVLSGGRAQAALNQELVA